MSTADRKLQRRMFLRALGLGIQAPLAWSMSRLAVAQPGARPRRLCIVYVPHGMPAEHYDPGGRGMAFDLNASPKVGVLKVFKPYQNQFALLRGIEYTGRTQHASIAIVLTGDGMVSVDQAIGKAIGQKPLLLGANAFLKDQFGPDNNMFRNTEWVAPELNPVKAAQGLGGSSSMPAPGAVDEADFQRAALALGVGELEALTRELGALTATRTRLGVHLDSLRALQGRRPLGGDPLSPAACGMAGPMPALAQVQRDAGSNPNYVYDKANFKALFLAHLEVARQALICGTRVVGLQTMWASAQLNFGFMGVAKDHHDPVSHSRDVLGRGEFARVQQWIYSQIEEQVLRPLRAAPDPLDPAHNVLDNTLVYLCSEIADGNEHNCKTQPMDIGATQIITQLPLMLIGGGGGAVVTGQALDFGNRSHKDLLATLCGAMGVSGAAFSGTPIKELLA